MTLWQRFINWLDFKPKPEQTWNYVTGTFHTPLKEPENYAPTFPDPFDNWFWSETESGDTVSIRTTDVPVKAPRKRSKPKVTKRAPTPQPSPRKPRKSPNIKPERASKKKAAVRTRKKQ